MIKGILDNDILKDMLCENVKTGVFQKVAHACESKMWFLAF